MKLLFNESLVTTPDPLGADAGIISRDPLSQRKTDTLRSTAHLTSSLRGMSTTKLVWFTFHDNQALPYQLAEYAVRAA